MIMKNSLKSQPKKKASDVIYLEDSEDVADYLKLEMER